MIFMSHTDFLINKYNQRVPYENRGKEHDKLRKRESRIKRLYETCDDLFDECNNYKRLRLSKYEKERVKFMVKTFGNNFKMLHGQAKSDTIILAFIFYIKITYVNAIRLNDYKIASKHNLSDLTFEIILCRLAEYYMQRMPIVPVGSTNYDHEILSRNGGKME